MQGLLWAIQPMGILCCKLAPVHPQPHFAPKWQAAVEPDGHQDLESFRCQTWVWLLGH